MKSQASQNPRVTRTMLGPIAALGLCLFLGLPCRSGRSDDSVRDQVPEHAFVGTSTCASSSCHGNSDSRDPREWKHSYWRWAKHDRHRRAFEVLFAPRSVEMIERLDATTRRQTHDRQAAEIPHDQISYLRLLETRCIGCHATPPANSAAAKTLATPAKRLAKDYADGVSCESCHGAAEQWTSAHILVDWKDLPGKDKFEQFGFALTKPLAARPAVCVGCHVGPMESGGQSYEVDHDLIAAGHPRLAFEFSSAMANLPSHWDKAQDQERHRLETDSTTFHFDAWKHGQVHTARAHAKLRDRDLAQHQQLDLSRYDCFACHHQLRANGLRPSLPHASGVGEPQESWNSSRGVLALFWGSRATDSESQPTRVDPFGEPMRRWLDAAAKPLSSGERLNAVTPQQVLVRLANSLQGVPDRSWDAALEFDLALRAWLADVDPDASSPLADDVRKFDGWLESSFDSKRPNRYHSPARFHPADPALTELLERLQQGITQMRTSR